MEHENKYYSSNGKGNLAVTLGAIGTGLGVLNGGIAGLNGIFGNNANCGCNEDHLVNRYEAAQSARISELETQNKFLESTIYNDGKFLEFYKYVDGKFNCIDARLAQQETFNAVNTTQMSCINNQIAQLMSLTSFAVDANKICPPGMPLYNAWVAPTSGTTTAGA
jgi:hypothetical protein